MRTPRLLLAPALLALAVGLTACSAGGGDADETATASQVDAAEAPAADDGGAAGGAAESATDYDGANREAEGASYRVAPEQQAVIRNGSVSLRSDDVGKTRFDVQALVDEYGGQVSDDKTETDKSGEPLRSRMVLRVPSDDFDEVMDRLAGLATLASTTSSSEDVTTQVIDVEARIEVQERSVRRVQLLLDQAGSIRDIMAIERELAQRQAELDSLKQQQAWLSDQTSFATVRVHVERTPDPKKAAPEDENGFLAGLSAGWDALQKAFVGAATVLGALLPFALVGLLVGVPVWLVVRRRRRTVPVAPVDPGPAGA